MSMASLVAAVTGTAVIAAAVLGTLWRRERAKRIEAERKIPEKDACIAHLVRHADELSAIKDDRNGTDRRISDAKSDGEIADIVAAVVAANNARVRDPGKD